MKYVENSNNSCIFSKMVAKMAAKNFKQMFLSFFWHTQKQMNVSSHFMPET